MKTFRQIVSFLDEIKSVIIMIGFFGTMIYAGGDWAIDRIADEVVSRSGNENYKMYKLQHRRDSIRYEMGEKIAVKVLAQQDSITFVLFSINEWMRTTDRRIAQISKKILRDTIPTAHQRELVEIRRLLAEKEKSEAARIETEKRMKEYIRNAQMIMDAVKRGETQK